MAVDKQHIAPASGHAVPQTGPNLRISAAKVGVSRQYVLPPRPKPGRKPKPKDKPIKVDVASPASNAHSSDADCGLCERDECLCQDIGIKNSPAQTPQPVPPRSTPQSAAELGTEITSASVSSIPLPRRPNPAAPKFKRASVEGMLSPVALRPVYNMKLAQGAGCGFCTDNSPCICAEHEAKAELALKPKDSEPGPEPEPEPSVDFGCSSCQEDAMSMLFCVSLGSSQPLPTGAVAIPCTMAHRTIVKHPKFSQCDLGQIIVMLESSNKMIGVQSVNRVLQHLNDL